jgi:hypothetical protein
VGKIGIGGRLVGVPPCTEGAGEMEGVAEDSTGTRVGTEGAVGLVIFRFKGGTK